MDAHSLPTGSSDDQRISMPVNYAAATTAPHYNQQPTRPLTPINQANIVHSQSQRFLLYDRQDKETIARQNGFDLEGKKTAMLRKKNNNRMSVKSHAITCWSNIDKKKLMDDILTEFNRDIVQYVCVASEVGPSSAKPHVHIQIILKRTVNKKGWFLDKFTGVHCNYQVTANNCAWNSYIKKDGDYVEYGEFCSTSRDSDQFLPSPSPAAPVDLRTTASPLLPLPPAKRLTVRAQADERRMIKKDICRTALAIARESIEKAMGYAEVKFPEEFIYRSGNYLDAFTYVHNRAQEQRPDFYDKEFNWPLSFPNCTPQLRDAVQMWINENFRNPNRPKCLVLIGPTGVGKTSFAMSLPGRVCYFKGRWSLSEWSNKARYLVFDDIPWDDFEKQYFPRKKDLLSANGKVITTDKYVRTKSIYVKVPAIVLLNPGDEGSLTATPMTLDEQKNADYWSKRAFVYNMGPDEYFYKSEPVSSSAPSADTLQRPLLGHANEFDENERLWLEGQERRRRTSAAAAAVAAAETVDAPSSSLAIEDSSALSSDERF